MKRDGDDGAALAPASIECDVAASQLQQLFSSEDTQRARAVVHVAFALLGCAPWMLINALWSELPILIHVV
jgi:hypothetical protein